MITIEIPETFVYERKYVIDVIFRWFFGIDYLVSISSNRKQYLIRNNGTAVLIIEDHFFCDIPEKTDYKKKEYLPQPLTLTNVSYSSELTFISLFHSEEIQVVVEEKENKILCRSDIFAAIFFMLTRWEECCVEEKDIHDRTSFKDCVASKYAFVHRPIVNEYIEFIWNILSDRIPRLGRKNSSFQLIPTHDVDVPFEYVFLRPMKLLRQLIGDLIKRKSINLMFRRLTGYVRTKLLGPETDPLNTIVKIIDWSDQYGVKSYFNFFGGRTSKQYDCDYDLRHPYIQHLLKIIHSRGHFIGIHPSYTSSNDPKVIGTEYQYLRSTCSSLEISQKRWGGRQHYLKWDVYTTPKYLEQAGIEFDMTLGFYDKPGFRCGTCSPFPLFDLKSKSTLTVIEYPLIAMECSFFDYAGLSMKESYEIATELYRQINKYKGCFVILWHNDKLFDECSKEYKLYHSILQFHRKEQQNIVR